MIQTESTPNPNSLKFLSEKTISAIGNEEFQKGNSQELANPFIKELFSFHTWCLKENLIVYALMEEVNILSALTYIAISL